MRQMLPQRQRLNDFNEKEFSALKKVGYSIENPEGLFGLYFINAPYGSAAIISVKIFNNISIIVHDKNLLPGMKDYAKRWEEEFNGRADIVY